MSRHLGTVTMDEWEELQDALIHWLTRHNIAGSIARDYSLYEALETEHDKAVTVMVQTTEPGSVS